MQADIDSKKQKVKLLEDEIGFISETQKEAQEFMSNLEKVHLMRTNLIKTKELPKVVEPSTTDGMLDMVIAFDTTGSMSAYINAVKTHVKELVPKLFSSNPDLRIGIVAFGDYYDMKSKDNFGKAYQVLDLTNDENKKSFSLSMKLRIPMVGMVMNSMNWSLRKSRRKLHGERVLLRQYY